MEEGVARQTTGRGKAMPKAVQIDRIRDVLIECRAEERRGRFERAAWAANEEFKAFDGGCFQLDDRLTEDAKTTFAGQDRCQIGALGLHRRL